MILAVIVWVWLFGGSHERPPQAQSAVVEPVATNLNPDGSEGERQSQAANGKAEAARQAQEAIAAERVAKQQRLKDSLDRFVERLTELGIYRSQVESVSLENDFLLITVSNDWHLANYQIRLQAAQNLWRLWASIASPSQPDNARIKIVDFNRNVVGGSRILGGSLIWVQDK